MIIIIKTIARSAKVNECQVYFGFDLPSVIIVRQSKKFLSINATCTVSLLKMLHVLFLVVSLVVFFFSCILCYRVW